MARTFRDFHDALSIERHGRERIYPESPDSAGAGIGVTAEYFGVVYEVSSWTLEIEPRQSAARRILLREPGSGPGRGELLPRGYQNP